MKIKNILILFAIIFTFTACKSTKETVIEEKVESSTTIPDAHERGTSMGDRTLPNRPRRQQLDPEKLVAQLGLSELQEEEFLALWTGNEEKMKALRENAKGDRMGMREGMKKLRDERKEGIESILTEDQMAKFTEIMNSMRRGKKRKGR